MNHLSDQNLSSQDDRNPQPGVSELDHVHLNSDFGRLPSEEGVMTSPLASRGVLAENEPPPVESTGDVDPRPSASSTDAAGPANHAAGPPEATPGDEHGVRMLKYLQLVDDSDTPIDEAEVLAAALPPVSTAAVKSTSAASIEFELLDLIETPAAEEPVPISWPSDLDNNTPAPSGQLPRDSPTPVAQQPNQEKQSLWKKPSSGESEFSSFNTLDSSTSGKKTERSQTSHVQSLGKSVGTASLGSEGFAAFGTGGNLLEQAADALSKNAATTEEVRDERSKLERAWGPFRWQALAAGNLSGINFFIECIAIGTIIFNGEVTKKYTDIAIKHALIGVGVSQFVASVSSKYTTLITPTGFEVLPFLYPLVRSIEEGMLKDREENAVLANADLMPGERSPEAPEYGISDDEIVSTILMASALLNLVTAVLLGILGHFRLGNMVSFIPQTVLIGLFACIGYSLYTVGYEQACGESFDIADPSSLEWFQDGDKWPKALLVNLLGISLYLSGSWAPEIIRSKVFLIYFFGGTALFNAIFLMLGWDLDESANRGWLLEKVATEREFWALYQRLFAFGDVNWTYISMELWRICIGALLGPIINIVLNYTMLTPILKEKADLNRELVACSAAAGLQTLTGGLSAYIAICSTRLHLSSGGSTRWSTLYSAGVVMLFFLVNALVNAVRVIPNVILGGIFIHFGIDFLVDSYLQYQTLKRWEYCMMWVMVALSIFFGLPVSVLFGLIVTYSAFIVLQSRTPMVQLETFGSIFRSISTRTVARDDCLKIRGRTIYIVRLQGLVGFATAVEFCDGVVSKMDDLNAKTTLKIEQFVLDFTLVTGLDTSGVLALTSMAEECRERPHLKHLHFTGLNPRTDPLMYTMLLRHLQEFIDDEYVTFYESFHDAYSKIEASVCMPISQRLMEAEEEEMQEALKRRAETQAAADAQGRLEGRRPTEEKGMAWRASMVFGLRRIGGDVAYFHHVDAMRPIDRCRRLIRGCMMFVREHQHMCPAAGALYYFPLLGRWTRQRFGPGEQLCAAGEEARGVWLLFSGEVSASMSVDFDNDAQMDENEVSNVGIYSGMGHIMGIAGLMPRTHYTETLEASTVAETFFVSHKDIALIQRHKNHRVHRAALALFQISLLASQRRLHNNQILQVAMQGSNRQGSNLNERKA